MRFVGLVVLLLLSVPVMAKPLDRVCEERASKLALEFHQKRFEDSAETAHVVRLENRGTLGMGSDMAGKPTTLYTVFISDETGKSMYAVLRYYNETECNLKTPISLEDEVD